MWPIMVTHTQSFAPHLTHPSAHTPGAVGSLLCCSTRDQLGVLGFLLKGLTSVLVSKVERMLVLYSPHRKFLPDPRFEPTTSGYKSDALSIRPRLPPTKLYFV